MLVDAAAGEMAMGMGWDRDGGSRGPEADRPAGGGLGRMKPRADPPSQIKDPGRLGGSR